MNSIYTNWTAQLFRFKKDKCKKEVPYPSKSVRIPELRMTVKVREDQTIKDWIINYCRTNPLIKPKLYKAYNIIEE